MGSIGTEIVVVLLLVLANGILAMSEMALVSSKKVRLQQRAEAGDAGAVAALRLADSPTRFLSTVQIGITSVGILTGAFSGATLAQIMSDRFSEVPALDPYSEALGVSIVVVCITFVSLILGELVPKRLALQNPERVASLAARPMGVLSRIATPFVVLLSLSTETVLRLLRVRPVDDAPITDEEVTMLVREGAAAGVIERAEGEMVASVFRLGDRPVGQALTPRRLVAWLDIRDDADTHRQLMAASPHYYFPICDGDLDNVLGIVSVRDLWTQSIESRYDLRAAMRPPLFVHETLPVLHVLEQFKASGTHVALVIDEHGSVQGLITLTDVMSEIIGHDGPESVPVQREDGSWLLDGSLLIEDAVNLFGWKRWPGDRGGYHTLAGYVMAELGRIAVVGDRVPCGDAAIEVMDMDGHRIDKVLMWLPSAELSSAG